MKKLQLPAPVEMPLKSDPPKAISGLKSVHNAILFLQENRNLLTLQDVSKDLEKNMRVFRNKNNLNFEGQSLYRFGLTISDGKFKYV